MPSNAHDTRITPAPRAGTFSTRSFGTTLPRVGLALIATMAVATSPSRARAQHPASHAAPAAHDSATKGRSRSAVPAGPSTEHGGHGDHSDHSSGSPGMRAMMVGPLGLPMTRAGSGTSWLPDSAPMPAHMFSVGSWGLMLHGVAFLQYDRQWGDRGAAQFGSVNWGMLSATRQLGAGRLQLRGMASAEPWTLRDGGYPLLLQTGETYRGRPLHDRQHPHDLVMELAALYERPLTSDVAMQLYVAPVGEPAIGPVAFPHRPSAAADPFATLGHHWQDATHISFGVITAGLFTRTVKLEGSIFNGREPDENRTNFDYRGRSLDSYAGRLTVNPTPSLSLSAAYAHMKSPESLHPDESANRVTASVLYDRRVGALGAWSSAIVFGANAHPGERASNSGAIETLLDLDGRNTIFARAELVEKTAEELVAPESVVADHHARFTIGALSGGYLRELGRVAGGSLGIGARGAVSVVPSAIAPLYGTRAPVGLAVYARFRPMP